MTEPIAPTAEPVAPSPVNAIIAQALEKAGVPEQNINIPAAEAAPVVPQPIGQNGLPLPPTMGQQEPVIEGAQPPKVETPGAPPVEPIVPALSKADIETAITKATGNLQSLLDRKINAINTQMTNTIGALNQFFAAQEETSITGLPADEQVTRRLDRLEKPAAPKIHIAQPAPEQPGQDPTAQLKEILAATGIAETDKRIDWAPEATTFQAGFTRFMASVKLMLLEDQTTAIQELKKNGTKEIAKLRKKTGVDEVSTSGPAGAGVGDTSKLTAMQKIELGYQQQEAAKQ